MGRRSGYEFDNRIKDEEFTRWHAKNPGREDASLEVHHILNVSEGKKRGVPREAIKSQQNAVAVESGFHKKIHREQAEEDQEELANWFISLWRKLF